VLAVYLGVKLRLRRMKRDYERLEGLVEQRTQQLREAAERLKDLSLTDPLTGLRNRRYLREMIGAEVKRVRRLHRDVEPEEGLEKAFIGFILLDIDHFKEVNDSFGHEAGDALIKSYATRLQQALRGEDAVIRWGGEEFLAVCREVNPDSLHQLCQRVVERLAAEPFKLPGGKEIGRTSTAGFSVYPFAAGEPDRVNHESVINLADHALYIGKRNGRDLVVGIAAGERPLSAEAQGWFKRDIARAVAEGYLRVLGPEGRELEL
jgi:diguanylate cyclase (GGDEF)-like protein